jgi:hypothetical protein
MYIHFDEADAFKRMLDRKYTTLDIAFKMAKPESFIYKVKGKTLIDEELT